MGLLLPCNVAERFLDEHHTEIEAMNPEFMVSATGNPELAAVAAEARERLAAALASLSATHDRARA
jgi:hypothetical protein